MTQLRFIRQVFCASFLSITAMNAAISAIPSECRAGVVEIKENTLHIDGQPQPQLFGAEVQYFRLRGGQGRNIPREKVIALWNKALDQLVATGANAISFYIPWDFHEYAPGKFDFDGAADEDGDGLADFPSRDVKTWFKLIEAHGIRHVMARPGPYINAEWGFLGFGAVPLWFHERFPDSHMLNSRGQRTTLYSYNNPDFAKAWKNWLTAVYHGVLKEQIGEGRPVHFLQIDNETNYMWQSIYNHDYGPRAVADYRLFLKKQYRTVEKLNAAHKRAWRKFADVQPPTEPGKNLGEDQDWYRFHDDSMHVYLESIRRHWESMGVTEPTVLFTLAESFNASNDGVLPNARLRNDRGRTGMMTVNLYPKTADNATNPLFNQPFKADHDVKACDSSSDFYLGQRQEWSLGPEIQGGWWRGTHVSLESRRQTYLSTMGHGLKALFVYYFNEGQNWQTDWVGKQAAPYFKDLKEDPRFKSIPDNQLPDEFWRELNETFATRVIAGFDLRWAMHGTHTPDLYFDAPIDGNADRKPGYDVLKEIGQKIVVPYGEFLASATELTDPVCFIKDTESNLPTTLSGVRSTVMNSDWAAGLVGYLLQAGINPKIHHWGLNDKDELDGCRLLIYQDNGFASPSLLAHLQTHLGRGGGVLTFIGTRVLNGVLATAPGQCSKLATRAAAYEGKKCQLPKGVVFHMSQPLYAKFNSDDYAEISDVAERRSFIEQILTTLNIHPQLQLAGGGDRVVAFGRLGADKARLYVTVKNGVTSPVSTRVLWSGADLNKSYRVSRLLESVSSVISGRELATEGFNAYLSANGSDAFFIEPIASIR